jgi:hypothetical protein
MPNVISLYVEEPDQIRNAGAYDTGALMRIQSSSTEGGTYADLTGTGATPTVAIIAATRAYTAYDPAGTTTTWYRTRYENAGGTRVSEWASPFQVQAEEAGPWLCSVADVKQRLGLTDTPDDEWLQEQIVAVTDEIETLTGRRLRPDPPTGDKTVYLDYSGDGTTLWLPRGVRSVTYLGVASTDQPADGSGTYTDVTTYAYVDPPEHERSPGWPGTRITLAAWGYQFYAGHRTVKLTGAFGWATVPAPVRAIAELCVVSAYRGRSSGGATSYTIGVDGERTYNRLLTAADMKTLRYYADPVVA